jgi:hypothetical protein
MFDFNLGDLVTCDSGYNNKEIFKVVGIRKDSLELEGDWSGGTLNVCQRSWVNIKECELYKLGMDIYISKFENGKERFAKSPIVNKTVQMLARGEDHYKIIDELCTIIDGQTETFRQYVMSDIYIKPN